MTHREIANSGIASLHQLSASVLWQCSLRYIICNSFVSTCSSVSRELEQFKREWSRITLGYEPLARAKRGTYGRPFIYFINSEHFDAGQWSGALDSASRPPIVDFLNQ